MKTINPEDRFNEYLTAQEVFDHCVYHLGTMKDQCSVMVYDHVEDVNVPNCQYRREDGETCAAGYFFKEEEYKPEIENSSILAVIENGYAPVRLNRHRELIFALQRAHDNAGNWNSRKYMREALKLVAVRRDIQDTSILDHPDMAWNK